jgi:hypothetical protein
MTNYRWLKWAEVVKELRKTILLDPDNGEYERGLGMVRKRVENDTGNPA